MTTKRQNHPHELGIYIVLALMYLILIATLYLIWWKANPLWWA